MQTKLTILISALLMNMGVAIAQSNLILGGDFEAPSIQTFEDKYPVYVPGWDFAAGKTIDNLTMTAFNNATIDRWNIRLQMLYEAMPLNGNNYQHVRIQRYEWGGWWDDQGLIQTVNVEANQNYTLSFDCRINPAATGQTGFAESDGFATAETPTFLIFRNASTGANISSVTLQPKSISTWDKTNLNNNWERKTYTFTTLSDLTSLSILFAVRGGKVYSWGGNINMWMDIDNVSFVKDVVITASVNNETMGSVSGAGSKEPGSTVTLVATPNSGYSFLNWKENGSIVSTSESYSFTVSSNKTLVANFVANAVNVANTQNVSELTITPASEITVSAGGTLLLDANTTLNTISVAPGAKVTLSNTKTLTANSITLQSSSTGTATFVDENTADTPSPVSGIIQQHIAATNRNWYTAIPITTANVEVLSSANPVAYWDEPTGMFKMVAAESPLNPLRGYIAASIASLSYTGTFNSGLQTIGLTRTAGKFKEGFNLIGNPYPSYLDWSMVDTVATNISTSIWYRTKTSEGAYTFDTYNRKSNVGTTNGVNTVTNLIPPMQAFWVRAKVNGGMLTLTNAMRKHADVTANKLKAPAKFENTQPLLRLKVSNGTNSDEAILLFNPNASDGYDDYDSPKMSNAGTEVPEIFTVSAGEELVINGLKSLTTTREVALGFYSGATTNQTFTLKATEISNFETGTRIIIKDNLVNGQEVDITDGQSVTFASGAVNDALRFSIIFRVPGVSTTLKATEKINAQVYVNADNQITIIAPKGVNYFIFNVLGQKINSGLTTSNTTLLTSHHSQGLYVVKLSENGKELSTKIMIK